MLSRYEFDADYVRRLVESDRSVEHHFVAYFSDFLSLKLRWRLRSREAIEDVRQETFVRVLRQLRQDGGLQHPERLGGFVNSVCNHVLLEKFREQNRYAAITGTDRWPDERTGLDQPLINDERKSLVRKVLARLRSRDAELLRLLFLEEVDRTDACRQLRISESCLRVVLHRAIVRFRRRLTDQESAVARQLSLENQVNPVKHMGYCVH